MVTFFETRGAPSFWLVFQWNSQGNPSIEDLFTAQNLCFLQMKIYATVKLYDEHKGRGTIGIRLPLFKGILWERNLLDQRQIRMLHMSNQ